MGVEIFGKGECQGFFSFWVVPVPGRRRKRPEGKDDWLNARAIFTYKKVWGFLFVFLVLGFLW